MAAKAAHGNARMLEECAPLVTIHKNRYPAFRNDRSPRSGGIVVFVIDPPVRRGSENARNEPGWAHLPSFTSLDYTPGMHKTVLTCVGHNEECFSPCSGASGQITLALVIVCYQT